MRNGMVGRAKGTAIGLVAGVMAIGAIGTPATAADTKGTIAIVNGRPGGKVDICLGRKELRSKARYGASVARAEVGTGKKTIRFFKPDPRRCRGQRIAKTTVELEAGTDLTVVLTKRAPKVVVFDNLGAGEIPPDGVPYEFISFIVYRHAAEFTANLHLRTWDDNPEFPVNPTAAPLWTKGDQVKIPEHEDEIWQVRVTLPEATKTIALKRILLRLSRRYEHILVGTKPRNARLVFIDRRVSQPT